MAKRVERFTVGLRKERARLTLFHDGLAKVRRVLANIPTYMMFDDHDFTDDWNLNPMWYDRVYTTVARRHDGPQRTRQLRGVPGLGQRSDQYEKQDDYKKLLATIAQLFPTGEPGPDCRRCKRHRRAVRLQAARSCRIRSTGTRRRPVNPIIKWHLLGARARSISPSRSTTARAAASCRATARRATSRAASIRTENTAQTEQIPAGPFTDGKEVLLVIAPLQVIGPPLLDELVAPAAFKVFDLMDYTKKLDPNLQFGSRGMIGTNPDAIEAWAFDPMTMEALLQRLKPYRQVVLLSGDVHYSASTVMSYFTKGEADPARFVQFTSSGFKNVMPSYITIGRSQPRDRAPDRARQLGAERMGWLRRPSNPDRAGGGQEREGHSARAIARSSSRSRRCCRRYGWPDDTTINPAQLPDWSWRVEPIFDLRADEERPAPIQPLRFSDAAAVETVLTTRPGPGVGQRLSGCRRRASSTRSRTLKNSRQILFRSNFGLVRFERREGVLHAIHEMYTVARRPEESGTEPLKPQLFILHEAALAAPGSVRPEDTLVIDAEEPAEPERDMSAKSLLQDSAR